MSLKPEFTQNAEHVLDELLVGGPVKMRTVTLTDLNGQGALVRGSVLGIVSQNGNYGQSEAGAVDGSQIARAVLAQDADPSGGDVSALIYEGCDANGNQLTFGAGHSVATTIEDLRAVGIHLKDPVKR